MTNDSQLFNDALLHMAQDTSVGQAFFERTALRLGQLFGVKYTFVGLIDEVTQQSVSTLATAVDGQLVDNIQYDLFATPCANVIGQQMCVYTHGVCQHYPDDLLLQQMGVESYLGAPIFDAQGQGIGLLVLLDDKPQQDSPQRRSVVQLYAARAGAEIDRMRLENSLRDVAGKLEQQVALRTAELREANQRLSDFSHSIAHDLVAPLRRMTGFCQALMEQPEICAASDTLDLAQRIERGGQEMMDMVQALLQFAKLARTELRRQTVALPPLIEQLVQQAQAENPQQQCALTLPDQGAVNADPVLLGMALGNLINNAFKYSRQQPLSRIDISFTEQEKGMGRIAVRDNGVGFDMQFADKLFNVFQRLHDRKQYEGNGIGLANVRNIVSRHGGSVGCDASPGAGAHFWIDLPLAKQATASGASLV